MARDISHMITSDDGRNVDADIEFLRYEDVVRFYKEGDIAQKIADLYSVPLRIVEVLAQDPDHGGKATVSSFIETMVGLELERDGILGITVGRGPSMTDLVDGWKRKWDVKAPPVIQGIMFDMKSALHSIKKKFDEFPDHDIGILLCVSFMNGDIYYEFQAALAAALSKNELFRVRQVEIKAFPECRYRK